MLLAELLDSGGDARSEAAYILGASAAYRGNYELALNYLDMVSDQNRYSPDAYYYKAAISWKKKEPWNARNWCLRALAKAPEHAAALDLKRQIDLHFAGQPKQRPSEQENRPKQSNARARREESGSRSVPMTDVTMPTDRVELARYKKWKTKKARADLMIDLVHKYPWSINIFRSVIAAFAIGFMVYIGGMLLGFSWSLEVLVYGLV